MSNNNYFSMKLLKDSMKMINPVIITLLGAILLTTVVTYSYSPPGTVNNLPPSNPFSNNTNDAAGAAQALVLNSLYFVALIFIGGIIFIIFIKYGLHKLMDYILATVFFLGTFAFSLFIFPAILFQLFNNVPELIILLGSNQQETFNLLILSLSLLFAIITALGLFYIKNYRVHNVLMIIFGMSMGTIFGVTFDSLSLIGVLIALALYDIYAVFRGPLKNMFDKLDMKSERTAYQHAFNQSNITLNDYESKEMREPADTMIEQANKNEPQETTSIKVPRNVSNPQISNGFTLPVYATPYITIGLGDFAFFSVLIAKATYLAIKGDFLILPATSLGVTYWSLIILPFIGILIGCYLTFVLLQKYEILPALPLPISFGLIGLGIAFALQIIF